MITGLVLALAILQMEAPGPTHSLESGHMPELTVHPFTSFAELSSIREEMDALNLGARRPCPFATFEYLQTLVAHDEYARPDDQMLFLAVREGSRLVGYLPLRRRRERVLGVECRRIGMLADHDTDRPGLVARAEDEARCCEAVFRHLLTQDRNWTFLELLFQDAESGLDRLPTMASGRFHVRRFENMPNTTAPLPFRSLKEYYKALGSSHRRNVASRGRKLLQAGRVEVVASCDPRARRALLDLFLDVERRSWKEAAQAGIRRHPKRMAFYRELCEPGQPLALGFDIVLLDGLPVAASIAGSFEGTWYSLEVAFDEAYDDVGPGTLLWLMTFGSAIQAGARAYNLGGNYAYYKSRWGGVVTPTAAIQVYRVPSIHWLKARGGELRRRLLGSETASENFNPERRKVAGATDEGKPEADKAGPRPVREVEREEARRVLHDLEVAGVPLVRVAGPELEAILPFQTKT